MNQILLPIFSSLSQSNPLREINPYHTTESHKQLKKQEILLFIFLFICGYAVKSWDSGIRLLSLNPGSTLNMLLPGAISL